MVLVKVLMKIGPSSITGMLVMSMASISPSWREVSPAESLRWRAKLLLPRFGLETAVLHPKSIFYIFLGQLSLYSKRRGPEASQGPHKASGRSHGGPCPVALWATGGPPPVFLFFSIVHIFNKKSP